MRQKLIQHYVNLYRQWHGSNEGLESENLNNMTKKQLEKRITLYKYLLKI